MSPTVRQQVSGSWLAPEWLPHRVVKDPAAWWLDAPPRGVGGTGGFRVRSSGFSFVLLAPANLWRRTRFRIFLCLSLRRRMRGRRRGFRPPRSVPIRGASVAPPSRHLRARSNGGASPALVGARWVARQRVSHPRGLGSLGPWRPPSLRSGSAARRRSDLGCRADGGQCPPYPFPFATFFPRTGCRRFSRRPEPCEPRLA